MVNCSPDTTPISFIILLKSGGPASNAYDHADVRVTLTESQFGTVRLDPSKQSFVWNSFGRFYRRQRQSTEALMFVCPLSVCTN